MTSPTQLARPGRIAFALVALAVLLAVPPAHALRLVNYNILNYPGPSGTARAPYFRTILTPLDADVIVAQEVNSGGPTQFLNEVLNVMDPGEWATVPFIDDPRDTEATLFYKTAKVQFLGQGAFWPNAADHLRYVHTYRIIPIGYSSAGAVLRIYTAHLKASEGFESQRLAECTGIRDSMNTMPSGTHAFACGDLNFYKQADEPGYAKLLESQANNIGRVYDLLPAGAWHDGPSFAPYHTQSTCKDGTCASGAATGGMDDRFDYLLPTYNLGTRHGLAVIPNTCKAVGQDGLHFNLNITDAPTIPEGAAYATALKLASDHLPLRLDLQLPAMILADASLVFDTVIVGATTQTEYLSLSNPAIAPADSLNCTFVASSGFGGPGPIAVAAGGVAYPPVTMSTATAGAKVGTLTISSDAPDHPTTGVNLSGTVLYHALASLDSTTTVLSDDLDFGDHEIGDFTDQSVRLFNRNYDSLHARLLVSAGVITGGAGRFSFVGGFTVKLIAGPGQNYALTFDDTGATLDSTYTATLTFTDADESLPGAAAQPNLVVSLSARVTSGLNAAADLSTPTATRLYAPSPNPLVGSTTVRLDLAQAVDASLAVFDPSGRRVALLRQGAFAPGRHTVTWDGRSEGGASVGSGIYFLRFSSPGLRTQAVRVAIVR
jgi:hypothetical protein